MSLPFVRLSTVGNDFDLLDGHENGQNSEEILEEKLRQIQLSTLKAKKRLRKNFDNVKRHEKVSLTVRVQKMCVGTKVIQNLMKVFMSKRFYYTVFLSGKRIRK